MKKIFWMATIFVGFHCHHKYYHQITKKDLIGNWECIVDSLTPFPWYFRFDSNSLYASLPVNKWQANYHLEDSNKIIFEDSVKGGKIKNKGSLEYICSDTIIFRREFTKYQTKLTMCRMH